MTREAFESGSETCVLLTSGSVAGGLVGGLLLGACCWWLVWMPRGWGGGEPRPDCPGRGRGWAPTVGERGRGSPVPNEGAPAATWSHRETWRARRLGVVRLASRRRRGQHLERRGKLFSECTEPRIWPEEEARELRVEPLLRPDLSGGAGMVKWRTESVCCAWPPRCETRSAAWAHVWICCCCCCCCCYRRRLLLLPPPPPPLSYDGHLGEAGNLAQPALGHVEAPPDAGVGRRAVGFAGAV